MQPYRGGTIFCDATSGYIHVKHQVSLTSYETIAAKVNFERLAIEAGVTITSYHTDNGIYRSSEFLKELHTKGQGIKMSGVSTQFQNGAAENAIKNTVARARTMMLHAAIRWPEVKDQSLWPYALTHAAYLHNQTPNQQSGLSPVELWTKTKSTNMPLQNLHVWGSPVYVLDPTLRDGSKLPKWNPRSRRGQYVGQSPLHASSVGLILNLQTGNVTPQYHVVHDNFFETVYADGTEPPPEWAELVTLSRSMSALEDDDDYVPELKDEWLTPEERQS